LKESKTKTVECSDELTTISTVAPRLGISPTLDTGVKTPA
jgi:hypothetical protein